MRDTGSAIDDRIAEQVRRLRDERGLSLEALADLSGVSRAMLSRIERGESSPTAQLLARLCGGLGVPVAALFAVAEEDGAQAAPVRRRADQPVWRDPASGYARRLVAPAVPGAALDLTEIEFPAGGRVALDSLRLPGVDQLVWLLEGTMLIRHGEVEVRLDEGDCLYMRLDEPTIFHNPSVVPARYAVIVSQNRPGA